MIIQIIYTHWNSFVHPYKSEVELSKKFEWVTISPPTNKMAALHKQSKWQWVISLHCLIRDEIVLSCMTSILTETHLKCVEDDFIVNSNNNILINLRQKLKSYWMFHSHYELHKRQKNVIPYCLQLASYINSVFKYWRYQRMYCILNHMVFFLLSMP